MPLTNLQLTHLLVPQGKIVATQFWTSFAVLIMLTAWSVRSKKLNNYRTSRIDITSVLAAMFALSVVATAVIIVTPKYQSELNGILGKVYINYASAWIATSLIISLFLGLMLNLNRRLFDTARPDENPVLQQALRQQTWMMKDHHFILTRYSVDKMSSSQSML